MRSRALLQRVVLAACLVVRSRDGHFSVNSTKNCELVSLVKVKEGKWERRREGKTSLQRSATCQFSAIKLYLRGDDKLNGQLKLNFAASLASVTRWRKITKRRLLCVTEAGGSLDSPSSKRYSSSNKKQVKRQLIQVDTKRQTDGSASSGDARRRNCGRRKLVAGVDTLKKRRLLARRVRRRTGKVGEFLIWRSRATDRFSCRGIDALVVAVWQIKPSETTKFFLQLESPTYHFEFPPSLSLSLCFNWWPEFFFSEADKCVPPPISACKQNTRTLTTFASRLLHLLFSRGSAAIFTVSSSLGNEIKWMKRSSRGKSNKKKKQLAFFFIIAIIHFVATNLNFTVPLFARLHYCDSRSFALLTIIKIENSWRRINA